MAFEFTLNILNKIAPSNHTSVKASLIEPLNKWLPAYEINTLLRIEHFIGQAAEESDSFNTLKEYASGREYEGRDDLGNTEEGDGPRFKGRGIFQITGRANYKRLGDILKIDLVNHPELAETPDVAVRTACEYWKSHNLSTYADNDDITSITKRINGGLNGFTQRQQFVDNADTVLSPFFPDQ
jgi:putative chitinase